MASSAKDILFKELKNTASQLNTTIRIQNDLITALQKMLEERNANVDGKDRIISNLQVQLEYFRQKLLAVLANDAVTCPVSGTSLLIPILKRSPCHNSLNQSSSKSRPANEDVSPKWTMMRCSQICRFPMKRWIR